MKVSKTGVLGLLGVDKLADDGGLDVLAVLGVLECRVLVPLCPSVTDDCLDASVYSSNLRGLWLLDRGARKWEPWLELSKKKFFFAKN